MYRFWRRTVEVQRFIYDNKLISYMDENSMEKKEKTMSTLNVVRNNILYIRNKFFVQRDAKFWYNIVSSFSLIYFLSVLEPCGYRFISKLEETIDVNTHLIKLKDDGNGNLHSDINGRIVFEFIIPRVGKRVDVVLVFSEAIFVLEFKTF